MSIVDLYVKAGAAAAHLTASNRPQNLRQKQPIDYNNLNSASTADLPEYSLLANCLSQPKSPLPQTITQMATVATNASVGNSRRSNQSAKEKAMLAAANPSGAVINSDNHYERQYTCKRCGFFTNNPRAVLYHRKEFHFEKINVHECIYCQYASQYSGKVERHTLLRHKIDINNTRKYLPMGCLLFVYIGEAYHANFIF
jgi:hypothetical protein